MKKMVLCIIAILCSVSIAFADNVIVEKSNQGIINEILCAQFEGDMSKAMSYKDGPALAAGMTAAHLTGIIDGFDFCFSESKLPVAYIGKAKGDQKSLFLALMNKNQDEKKQFLMVSLIPSKDYMSYGSEFISREEAIAFMNDYCPKDAWISIYYEQIKQYDNQPDDKSTDTTSSADDSSEQMSANVSTASATPKVNLIDEKFTRELNAAIVMYDSNDNLPSDYLPGEGMRKSGQYTISLRNENKITDVAYFMLMIADDNGDTTNMKGRSIRIDEIKVDGRKLDFKKNCTEVVAISDDDGEYYSLSAIILDTVGWSASSDYERHYWDGDKGDIVYNIISPDDIGSFNEISVTFTYGRFN